MLHDLALFHVTENDAVYFFFNILDLSIMTGQKITVFVFVFQLAQRIHITLEHTKSVSWVPTMGTIVVMSWSPTNMSFFCGSYRPH